MRKLVWFGATVMVAGAVAVYMAATYAVNHPDSYLGRCAAAAVYVGARSNPVTVATEIAQRRGGECPEQVEQATLVKPIAPCVPEDQADERDAAEAAEPVEPIKPEVLPQEPVAAPPDIEDGQMVPYNLPVVPIQTEEPMSGTEDLGTTTPIAVDIAIDEVAVCEEIPAPVEVDSPYEAIACPCDGDKPCAAGCCNDGCCCWLKSLMKIAGLVQDVAAEAVAETETPAEECETLAMPAECDDDEPQAEGVEEQDSVQAPSCPAPSYHHDHGGCPYMGSTCPYYRGTPVVTPVEPAKKVRSKKKAKQELSKPLSLEQGWKKKKVGAGFDEETQEQMGIDTMEFRPSDDPREPPGRSPF